MVCEDRTITGGLLLEQAAAAVPRTNDARLLAGPGTGKTKTMILTQTWPLGQMAIEQGGSPEYSTSNAPSIRPARTPGSGAG